MTEVGELKISQLIDELEHADDDMELLIMSQPDGHPLAYRIRDLEWRDEEGRAVVYIVEGSQKGYVPK